MQKNKTGHGKGGGPVQGKILASTTEANKGRKPCADAKNYQGKSINLTKWA